MSGHSGCPSDWSNSISPCGGDLAGKIAGLVHHLHGPSLKLKLVGGGRADSYLSLDFRYFFAYHVPP